jgi:hypothetical protein
MVHGKSRGKPAAEPAAMLAGDGALRHDEQLLLLESRDQFADFRIRLVELKLVR